MEPVTALFNVQHRPPGNRSGRPWEAVDYERMVEAIREGLDVPAIAERIGRPATSVRQRLRRLLPVAQRDCLADQVLRAAQAALADPEYDWQAEMLLSPPVVHQHITRTGMDGLSDDQLVTISYALLVSGGRHEAELLDEVRERLNRSRLMDRVIELRAQRAVRSSPYSIDEDCAWAQASYWVRGRSEPRTWRAGYLPSSYPSPAEW